MTGDAHALEMFFAPRSVAILGASTDPTKLGGRPLRFLLNHGYRGAIHPVNQRAGILQGVPAFASLAEIPGAVDHAIIALPAPAVEAAVEACAARGVRAATIFSAGFAEIDEAGRIAEARLRDIARGAGMRLLGPNCMGAMDFRTGFIASFAFMVEIGLPPLGRVALASQSGAFGGQALVMAHRRGLPLGAWVTTGNECDVELADCIAHFAEDDGLDVIMGYMEGCRTPDKLVAALDLAQRRGKAVVMLKAGRSAVGQAAVQSHTGALAGNDRVFDALFRQYGVHRAATIEGLFDVAYAAAKAPRAPERLGIFTVSGGVGILAADAAEAAGVEVPPLPDAAQAKLRALVPIAAVRNPVDGTAQIWADMDVFRRFLRIMVAEGDCDAVLLFLTAMPYAPHLQGPLREILGELRADFPDKTLVLSMLAPPELERDMAEAGYLLFEDTSRAIAALAALRTMRRKPVALPPPAVGDAVLPASAARNEHATKQALAMLGLPVLAEESAASLDAAQAAAARIGFPVVLKILSPDIAHKTEVGGVALGIADAAALETAWRAMMARVAAQAPGARLDGALVAPMLPPGGVEMILGVQSDPVFGPVVLAGFGGIHAELLDDVALRLPPFGAAEAEAMLRGLRGFPLLDGARGKPRADVAALARALARLSEIAAANAGRLLSFDLNPVVVRQSGQGVVVLDALATMAEGVA
jgi:acyl-CoA synthetase (NDP forming)